MFKTIVVGCDDSPATADAIALAAQLRDPEEGRLILVCVFPFFRGFASPTTPFLYADWLKEQAEESLRRAESAVPGGVPYEAQTIASPSAAEGLDDVAGTVHADLIVLGPSHHGTVGKLAGRATVQRMLHGAPCAVAVAGRGQDRRFGEHPVIAVATNGAPESDYAVHTAYAIAQATGATVRLCTAMETIVYATGFITPYPDPEFDREREERARERLADLAAQAPEGVTVESRVQWGTPANTLLEQAADADLIVAGSRGYGPLHRALAGAVSTGLLTNGEIPVLVTPRVVAAPADTELAGGVSAA